MDTCNAGAGTLAVTIDGPSKVSMDCTEVEEGYKVRYTPLVPGEYYISLKYNGYHIVGSPFKVTCTGTLCVIRFIILKYGIKQVVGLNQNTTPTTKIYGCARSDE